MRAAEGRHYLGLEYSVSAEETSPCHQGGHCLTVLLGYRITLLWLSPWPGSEEPSPDLSRQRAEILGWPSLWPSTALPKDRPWESPAPWTHWGARPGRGTWLRHPAVSSFWELQPQACPRERELLPRNGPLGRLTFTVNRLVTFCYKKWWSLGKISFLNMVMFLLVF